MRLFLLRIVCLLGLILSAHAATATHLLGGEMTYQYLDANGPTAAPYRYRLSMVIYYNADPLTSQIPNGRTSVIAGIYDQATGLLLQQVRLPRTQNTLIKPATAGGCSTPGDAAVQVRLNQFEAIVSLPAVQGGYYAFYSETARNTDITNMVTPNNEALTLYADFAPPSIPNSSPTFSDTAVAVICQGDTTIIINNAYDADGDRLEYTFGTPYGGNYRNVVPSYFMPPPSVITYPTPYSVQQPFGPAGYAFLDKNTGLSRYATPTLGKYVVAVDVHEYRTIHGKDTLISTTRRDIQLVARTCETNKPPVFSSSTAPVQPYTVLEGQPLTLNVQATDPEGKFLTLRATSVLLDGPNGFAATFNGEPGTVPTGSGVGYVQTGGTGALGGTFTFTPACGSARPQPYDLVVSAADNNCNSKSVAAIYQILVVGTPTASAGPDHTLCAGAVVQLGEAAVAGFSYQWSPALGLSNPTAANPTLTRSATGTVPVVVPYVLTATSAGGCGQRDTALVTLYPPPAADTIAGSASVCPLVQGVTYSIRNPKNATYQWTVVGGTLVSGQGTSSITVNWGPANANASVQVAGQTTFGCPAQPVVFPVRINALLITATPTGPLRVCVGTTQAYQTPYTNGSTYAWQIIGGTQAGTSLATVQVNWTRPGTGKIVVTETSSPAGAGRCLGVSDTLQVEVVPEPATNLALNGPDRVCAGPDSVRFVLPGFTASTYQFTLLNNTTRQTTPLPATGNTTSFPTPAVGTYTVSAQETSACAGPLYTRQLVVDPLPAAVAITGPARVCPEGLTGLHYSLAGLTGATYQWTVTGGTITAGQGTGSITVDFGADAATKTVQVVETSLYGCAGPVNALPVRPDNARVGLQVASVSRTDDHQVQLTFQALDNAADDQRVVVQRRTAGSADVFVRVGDVANTATAYLDATGDTDAQAYEYRLSLTNACGTELLSPAHTLIHTTALATEATGGRSEGSAQVRWSAYQGFAVQQYEVYRVADQSVATLVATVPGTTLQTALTTSSAGFNQCFRVKAIGAGTLASYSNDACVEFTNKLLLYNIITPNGDGLNDVFFIDNVALYPGNSLTIFDRWGKEVYATNDYRNTWGGEKTGPGTHYYLFKLANGTQYKGWFEIVK